MDNSQEKILVVEDDQFLREFYQELLTAEGYSVDVAADGEIALTKIQTNPYNLILLDIMLPKKDGVQILRDLKTKGAKSPKVIIVVLSNLGQDTIIKECFELGAAGYLIKSALNPDQVLTEVKSYLDKG
ncbi:MAG: response regulator [Candidatus Daviesbacteria bacterium]|nr:response regulator [Candidatus Daviesbacteria bacterium]